MFRAYPIFMLVLYLSMRPAIYPGVVSEGCSSIAHSCQDTAKPKQSNPAQAAPIFSFAEKMPEFDGGVTALLRYTKEHTIYPPTKDSTVSGTVIVSFVVTKDGKAINPKVLKGIPGKIYYDTESIRLVKGMPLWKPGTMNGRPVDVQYNLPISFVNGR